jgi:hypothetical protein
MCFLASQKTHTGLSTAIFFDAHARQKRISVSIPGAAQGLPVVLHPENEALDIMELTGYGFRYILCFAIYENEEYCV